MHAALMWLWLVPAIAAAPPRAVRQAPPSYVEKPLAKVLSGLRGELAKPSLYAGNDPIRAHGGEFVRVSAVGGGAGIVVVPSADADTPAETRLVSLPAVGKFKGRFDGDRDVVVMEAGGRTFYAAVPREQVQPLRGPYPSQRVGAALAETFRGRLEFQPGEPVRWRHELEREIRTGEFAGLTRTRAGRKAAVVDGWGRRFELPVNLVYKAVPGDPATPRYEFPQETLWAPFSHKDHLTGLFLHSAARLSSHPDYLAADATGRVKLLGELVLSLVRPDVAASFAELIGVRTFDDVLALGLGVCRHLSALGAAALREAGFDAALVHYAAPGPYMRDGHAWIEFGPAMPGVLDLMHGQLMGWAEVQAQAAQRPRSLAGMFYAQPGRLLQR